MINNNAGEIHADSSYNDNQAVVSPAYCTAIITEDYLTLKNITKFILSDKSTIINIEAKVKQLITRKEFLTEKKFIIMR